MTIIRSIVPLLLLGAIAACTGTPPSLATQGILPSGSPHGNRSPAATIASTEEAATPTPGPDFSTPGSSSSVAPSPTTGTGPALTAAPTASPTASPSPTGRAAGGRAPAYGLETVLDGYDRPNYVTSAGDAGQLFIVEQGGTIQLAGRASADEPWQKGGTFLDISDRVLHPGNNDLQSNEQGLLGLAFHPRYAENGLFYVHYTRLHDDPDRTGDIVIEEFQRAAEDQADPTSARLVLELEKESASHNGGWLGFGPDGHLYIALGDGTRGFRSKNLNSRFGKILRVDPLDPDGPGPARYTAPPDNPHVADGDELVWTSGLRNPFRASHDRLTGDLWIGDVGRLLYEEIDRAMAPDAGKGLDFGWWLCEGDEPYRGTPDDCGDPPNTSERPILQYAHPVADGVPNCAVAGGYVYRGTLQPALYGRYFFGDYCSGRIWSIPTDQSLSDPVPRPVDSGGYIVSFGEDADGELYAVDLAGSILRVVEE